MNLYFTFLYNSFRFAIDALKVNRLRTVLSLLGVTVGIFSIIAVLAAVDSLERNIKGELSGFDKNMIYLFSNSFGPSDIPKWKMQQFPDVTYKEYDYLQRNLQGAEFISFNLFLKSENIVHEGNYANDVAIQAAGVDVQYLDNVKVENGRFYNELEANKGAAVVVLGHEVAKTLFDFEDPVGSEVRLYGRKFKVVGVLEKQGAIAIGGSMDSRAYVPSNFIRQLYGESSASATPVIVLKPYGNVDINDFEQEIESKLRLYRGIKVGEDNNFFVNVFGGLLEEIDRIIAQMNVVGWLISGFSLLVGGFGIANIMFVSVSERTHLIGIQKAIGAKSNFILLQFLFEAIILALIGGVIGLFLVWLVTLVVNSLSDFEFALSFVNILVGLLLSSFIGLISGYLPARSAARLDPVEAIRSGM